MYTSPPQRHAHYPAKEYSVRGGPLQDWKNLPMMRSLPFPKYLSICPETRECSEDRHELGLSRSPEVHDSHSPQGSEHRSISHRDIHSSGSEEIDPRVPHHNGSGLPPESIALRGSESFSRRYSEEEAQSLHHYSDETPRSRSPLSRHSPPSNGYSYPDYQRSDSAMDLTKTKKVTPEIPPPPSWSETSPSLPRDFLPQPSTHSLPFPSRPDLSPSVASPVGLVPFSLPMGAMAGESPGLPYPYPFSLSRLSTRRKRPEPREKKVEAPSTVSKPKEEEEEKKATPVPDERKDDAYWERRRKNNEAAKRSRDARRQKEEEIAVRCAFLEGEYLKQQAQIQILKSENQRLQYLLFNRHGLKQ